MFKFALWLDDGAMHEGMGGGPPQAPRLHRREGDPHSPKLKASGTCNSATSLLRREIKNTDVVERYARDIKDGWWDRHVFNRGLVGLAVGTTALCIVVGS